MVWFGSIVVLTRFVLPFMEEFSAFVCVVLWIGSSLINCLVFCIVVSFSVHDQFIVCCVSQLVVLAVFGCFSSVWLLVLVFCSSNDCLSFMCWCTCFVCEGLLKDLCVLILCSYCMNCVFIYVQFYRENHTSLQ